MGLACSTVLAHVSLSTHISDLGHLLVSLSDLAVLLLIQTCTLLYYWANNMMTISSRSIAHLELIWHPIIPVSARLPSTSENIPFSSVFSQHSSVTLLRLRGLRNSSAILATLHFFDWYWLIDWHSAVYAVSSSGGSGNCGTVSWTLSWIAE